MKIFYFPCAKTHEPPLIHICTPLINLCTPRSTFHGFHQFLVFIGFYPYVYIKIKYFIELNTSSMSYYLNWTRGTKNAVLVTITVMQSSNRPMSLEIIRYPLNLYKTQFSYTFTWRGSIGLVKLKTFTTREILYVATLFLHHEFKLELE